MRGRWLVIGGMFAAGGLLACGDKKEAKDPSDTKSAEETPKWEGATNPNPDATPKPAGTGGGTGTVQEAPKQRTDQFDKEGTDVALKRAARQVKENCGQAKDDNGKAVGPWGKATVMVQLGHNGHTKGTTVPSPYQGKPSGNCVEKAFTGLSFPPWNGADAEVPWEIEIVEPGKEKKNP